MTVLNSNQVWKRKDVKDVYMLTLGADNIGRVMTTFDFTPKSGRKIFHYNPEYILEHYDFIKQY